MATVIRYVQKKDLSSSGGISFNDRDFALKVKPGNTLVVMTPDRVARAIVVITQAMVDAAAPMVGNLHILPYKLE